MIRKHKHRLSRSCLLPSGFWPLPSLFCLLAPALWLLASASSALADYGYSDSADFGLNLITAPTEVGSDENET